MEGIRLRKSCDWDDTTKYRCGGDMFACVYTHKLSLDLAIPKKPGHNSFLHLNKRGSRGILIAPIPLPRLFFVVGRDYSILIFYSISRFSLNHHYACIPIYSFRTTFAMDSIDPINDPRVSHCYARLNGIKYRMSARQLPLPGQPTEPTPSDYLLGIPSAGYKATVFLVQ